MDRSMNALRAITRVGTTSRACDMFMRAKAKDKQKGQKTDVKKTSKKPKAPADASKKNQGKPRVASACFCHWGY